jgi:7,8-dihydropterin-6-yl-methyl-4-(beta-D-ribofuranosyl)aminobenzene 5'-phosphate synthase
MPYGFRVSPLWWPALALGSPVIAPWLAVKAHRFRAGRDEADKVNGERLAAARPLELPGLTELAITVVVEERAAEGFEGDAAVAYLLRTDRGALWMDLGFGDDRPAFAHNAGRLGLTLDAADALLISHLHLDHMGGMAAQRAGRVQVAEGFAPSRPIPCYLPKTATVDGMDARVLEGPELLEAGLASTGPLARMMFFFGFTEEQVVVGRIEGKGLVVITGCGHPTVPVILEMVRRLSDEPLYALGGGLHFPVTGSRGSRAGVEMQQLFGTGKPLFSPIDDDDLTRTIEAIAAAAPRRVLLSAHDTCDHALQRLTDELDADVEVLSAGTTVRLSQKI